MRGTQEKTLGRKGPAAPLFGGGCMSALQHAQARCSSFLWREGPRVSEGGSACAPRLKPQHLPWALSNQTPFPTPLLYPTVWDWARPAPPPRRMEAMVSSISPQRRDEEVATPGRGCVAGRQEAGSAPWEGRRLPGKTLRMCRKRLVPQAGDSLRGLRPHLRGLAQQRRATEMHRTNK